MAGERDVRIRFTGEAKALKGTAGEVRSLFAGMVDDVDDMRLAGDKLGDAMKQAADKAKAELEGLQSTVLVVSDALGPEMVEALDKSGRGVEELVLDWKKLGLTYDDIKLSADQLAGGVKALDTSTRASTDAVGSGLKKVGAEADNSRSVLANMVGNSSQDIGELAGVSGTLGMTLGQLAEYATEGNISLRNLAKVAGPMAAVAVAVWAVSKGAEQAAKRSKEFSEAVSDLSRATDEQVLRTLGDAMMRAALDGASLTDQFKDMAEANLEGTKRLRDVALGAGYTREQIKLLDEAIANEEAATRRGEETSRKYGDAVEGVGDAAKGAMPALDGLLDVTRRWVKVQEDAEQATRDANDAMLAKIDTDFAAYDAQQNLIQAGQDLAEVKDDEKTAVDEVDQSQKNYVRTAIDAAAAVANQAEAQAIANGKTMDAKTKQDIMIESLMATAKTLDPKSPVRQMLDQYIAALLKIPPDVDTVIGFSLKNDGVVNTGGPVKTRASGGPVRAGEPYLVGEQGPELIVPGAAGTVVPAEQTARAFAGGGGGTTIVIEAGMIVTERDLGAYLTRILNDHARGTR